MWIWQSLGRPTLACLATAIEADRDGYYDALEAVGRGDLGRFLDSCGENFPQGRN